MLGGPWRLTEPCDVTVGGATWLDQAQETAARTDQNAGPQQEESGGRGPDRIGEATDSCRSTQEGDGTGKLPTNSEKMSTQVQRGRGDARRGMGLQTGSAEAERAAIASFRSVCDLVILISSAGRALTLMVAHYRELSC